MEAFAQAHNLRGYLETSSGVNFLADLSDNLFYTSMTRIPPKDPRLMWDYFSGGTGVRLEVRVHPNTAELRPILYHQSDSVTLLSEINECLANEGLPFFVPWTLSRIGAFYLSSTVNSEDEVRLLIKRFPGGIDCTENDGTWDYWPIKFGVENEICCLDLAAIHLSPSAAKSDVEAAIVGTAFAETVVISS